MQQLRTFASRLTAFLVLAVAAATSANAALINTPLPSNAYITLNGFDWAWGAGCITKGASDCDTPEFANQMSMGWSIAQASDMALAPSALNFLFAGANVPFNGVDPVSGASFEFLNAAYTNAASAGACASSYFTLGDGNNSCDWGNGGGQNHNTAGWYNQNGEGNFYADVLFIRTAAAVPETGTAALFGLGMLGLTLVRRRLMRV